MRTNGCAVTLLPPKGNDTYMRPHTEMHSHGSLAAKQLTISKICLAMWRQISCKPSQEHIHICPAATISPVANATSVSSGAEAVVGRPNRLSSLNRCPCTTQGADREDNFHDIAFPSKTSRAKPNPRRPFASVAENGSQTNNAARSTWNALHRTRPNEGTRKGSRQNSSRDAVVTSIVCKCRYHGYPLGKDPSKSL